MVEMRNGKKVLITPVSTGNSSLVEGPGMDNNRV